MTELTQDRLKELLHYDPETGVFTRRIARSGARGGIGAVAGSTHYDGYKRISIDGKLYQSHRLAWLYTHGTWPADMVDHINGVAGDNRLTNLREATQIQNMANVGKPSNNTSGYKGVSWHKRDKKWRAQINHQDKQKHLGHFTTPEEAHAAYCAAASALYGDFANFGTTDKT